MARVRLARPGTIFDSLEVGNRQASSATCHVSGIAPKMAAAP